MTSCNFLNLEQNCYLILDQQRRSSYRGLKDIFQVSFSVVSNILKEKHQHLGDYESNQNKNNSQLLQASFNIVYE